MKSITKALDVLIKAGNKKGIKRLFKASSKDAEKIREKQMAVERSQSTMASNFMVKPCDIFIIKSQSGVIDSTITVNIKNEKSSEDFYLTFSNCIEAWKKLKKINELEGRKVLYQIDDNEPINYEDSEPYKYRFVL